MDYYEAREIKNRELVKCWWFVVKITYHLVAVYSIIKLIFEQ